MIRLFLATSVFCFLSAPAGAQEALVGRAETNIRAGNERSIYMTEFWVPFTQSDDAVLYGDLRLMGDNQDNRELNLGAGYRQIVDISVMGRGVVGANAWFDRRLTERGSKFNQITVGGEWLGEDIDLRANAYAPLTSGREIEIPNANPQGPSLSGTGIVVDTNGKILEEPQYGFDLEVGYDLGHQFDFIKDNTDSFRIYGGGYYFNSDKTDDVAGWRTRFTADITENIQVGARFQRDDERGSQGFLEATFRFPFGSKAKYRTEGLRARLDESPERDIDIVTGSAVTDTGDRVAVINKEAGAAQVVLHVDNQAVGGGDGSAENPFNTLADAQATSSEQTIIYVNRGDGTSFRQDQGIKLNKTGQQLIGSGTDFTFDNGRFATANGASPISILIASASTAPVIGNVNSGQDGVTITADNITVAGITIDNANTGRDGIVVRADGATETTQGISIENVSTTNNRIGIYIHGANGGAVSAKVQNAITTANSQHGIAIYDDTNNTFEADLGGGEMGSIGNNVFAGNTLEDLAVEYDGRTLSAQNNWWGQESGPDTDAPDVGIAPQIYYGAPINDGLVGHWTFDTEWMTNTIAYDRSGQGNDGMLQGGLSLADQVTGQNRQALEFVGSQGIEIPQSASLDINNNEVTLISVVNLDEVASDIIGQFSSIYNSGQDSYILYLDRANNELRFKITDNSTAERPGIANADLSTTDWLHLSGVYDGSINSASIYQNTVLKDTHVNIGLVDNVRPGQNAYIGAQENSLFFKGSIDDTRVYSRALDVSEISELYRMDTSSTINTSDFLTEAP